MSRAVSEDPDWIARAGRLRDARKSCGLKQYELAFRAGVAAATVSNLETGRQGATVDTWSNLSAVLDVWPSWLVFGVGDAT